MTTHFKALAGCAAVALVICSVTSWAQLGAGPGIQSGSLPGVEYPQWKKYSMVKIANGVGGCANANGCWRVNSDTPVAAAAGTTQSVALFSLPANGYVTAFRIKTSTACTGPATLTTGLGTTSSSGLFMATSGYNLKTAVAATNVTTAVPLAMGSDTASAVNVVASITSTVSNIDQTAAGCAADFWVLWGVLP